MTRDELDILMRPEVREAVERNLGRDPLQVALDRRVPHAREVATQVKYLNRARTKLPSLWAARCIIPPRAFEQSSSEECAAAKRIAGQTLLDLTCGLGVDAMTLARRFARVVTLERDAVLADAVRENMRRMGIDNVEVVTASAEDYLRDCRTGFDWVYADPDRRTAEGRRAVRMEDCSPDMVALRPVLRRVSDRVAVKCSPLFDVDEAFRLFGRCGVEAVSLRGECKEVMIYADGRTPSVAAEAVGTGRFEVARDDSRAELCGGAFDPEAYGWLVVPDVALQKARLTARHLRGLADVWGNDSFAFARRLPEGVLGRTERIDRIEPYDAKALKRELRGRGVDILCRDFPFSVDEVRRRTGMRSGDEVRLALCRVAGRCWTVRIAKPADRAGRI